jgi:hypothetical protein
MGYKRVQLRSLNGWENNDYPPRPPCEFIIQITCAGAPWQAEGEVCGIPFYFRERHDRWRLESVLNGIHVQRAHGDGEEWTVSNLVEKLLATEPWKSAYSELL